MALLPQKRIYELKRKVSHYASMTYIYGFNWENDNEIETSSKMKGINRKVVKSLKFSDFEEAIIKKIPKDFKMKRINHINHVLKKHMKLKRKE